MDVYKGLMDGLKLKNDVGRQFLEMTSDDVMMQVKIVQIEHV
jgi:hypothetical protein